MAQSFTVFTKKSDGSPIANVQVKIIKIESPAYEEIQFTTVDGSASFINLPLGQYSITPTKMEYTFNPLTQIGESTTSAFVQDYLFIGIIDTVAPSKITDVNISAIKMYGMTINWTSQGDDANIGTASNIDIRYSTAPITNENWGNAIQVSGEPIPLVAGTSQSMAVTTLSPDTLYYWGIKTIDKAGNISELSNIVSAKTDILPPAYPDVFNGLPPITYFVRMNVDRYKIVEQATNRIYYHCQVIFVTDEGLVIPGPGSVIATLYSGNTRVKNGMMGQITADKHSWGGRYTTEVEGGNPLKIVRCRRPLLRFRVNEDFLNLNPIKIDRNLMKNLQYNSGGDVIERALNSGMIQDESTRIGNIGKIKMLFISYGNVLKSGSVKAKIYNSDAQGSIGALRGEYQMNPLAGNYYQSDDIDIGTGQVAYFIEAQTVNLYKFNKGHYYL